jgi:hypothetical protein
MPLMLCASLGCERVAAAEPMQRRFHHVLDGRGRDTVVNWVSRCLHAPKLHRERCLA